MKENNYRNRLAGEKSPYLLQHADNPVDWYPWGEEAFELARRENKPVFLSIGYSTCHWCHAMAHESFEDSQIANLMNDAFVSVKVDREERPDIDMLYMTVCQNMTGSGGWPLTIVMTPEKQPFFAGTYIPRDNRFGRRGMSELIPLIKETWENRNEEILSSASGVTAGIQKSALSHPGAELGEPTLHLAFNELSDRFDEENGGFGGAPKFPTPHNLLFLLRYWKRTGNSEALGMVEKSLQSMRRGGIYDHIGFGFHRYATDQRWLVPHFEKMLYDQALLAMAYTESFQATGNDEYAGTAREIFTYVLRDMTAPGGGFYSAEDADSEGEEGKFYLWTHDRIKDMLSLNEADLFMKIFNVEQIGNYTEESTGTKNRQNILHLNKSLEIISSENNIPIPELQERLESIKQKLFTDRDKRVHPQKDDKILTDWNGLMIAALARGGRVFNEPEYTKAAAGAVDFILNNMLAPDGRLLHRYRDSEAALPAHLNDYAFIIYGLLELYETTFEVDYLKKALQFHQILSEHFWDNENGGFYFTADDGEDLLVRQKEIYDGAIPSGNSIAMLNLLRLGRFTTNPDLENKAAAIGRAFAADVLQMPSAYTQLLMAVDFALGPSYEVVITGNPGANDAEAMLRAIRREFVPNKIVIFLPAGLDNSDINDIAPFTINQLPVDDKATAYVCTNYHCKTPTKDIEKMLSFLKSV